MTHHVGKNKLFQRIEKQIVAEDWKLWKPGFYYIKLSETAIHTLLHQTLESLDTKKLTHPMFSFPLVD